MELWHRIVSIQQCSLLIDFSNYLYFNNRTGKSHHIGSVFIRYTSQSKKYQFYFILNKSFCESKWVKIILIFLKKQEVLFLKTWSYAGMKQVRQKNEYSVICIKKSQCALAGVAQRTERRPANQRFVGSISSQGTCLGCRPGPQWGAWERQPHSGVSFPLFFSL